MLGLKEAPSPAERSVFIAPLDRAIAQRDGPRAAPPYATEKTELDRIERFEPSPLPGRSPGTDSLPDRSGDPRLFTAAYARGARVLMLALQMT